MNLLKSVIYLNIVAISLLFSLASQADNNCEITFSVDLATLEGRQFGEPPNIGSCKITNLLVRDSVLSAKAQKGTEDKEFKNRLAPLRHLNGLMSASPKIMLDLPFVFSELVDERYPYVMKVLGVKSAEIFGLSSTNSPHCT